MINEEGYAEFDHSDGGKVWRRAHVSVFFETLRGGRIPGHVVPELEEGELLQEFSEGRC